MFAKLNALKLKGTFAPSEYLFFRLVGLESYWPNILTIICSSPFPPQFSDPQSPIPNPLPHHTTIHPIFRLTYNRSPPPDTIPSFLPSQQTHPSKTHMHFMLIPSPKLRPPKLYPSPHVSGKCIIMNWD